MAPHYLKTYLQLFAAQVIALVGTGLSTIALTLLAYDLAKDSAAEVLGMALAIKMVAYVAFAPPLAALSRRVPRKVWLVCLDVARAAVVLAMPLAHEAWHVYLLIFILNFCAAGFKPSFSAVIPELLPKEQHYTRALAATRLAYDLENLLSPALAGLLLLILGYRELFAINSAAFVVSALLIVSARMPATQLLEPSSKIWGETYRGVQAYLSKPRLRALLCFYVAVAAASAMAIVNTVVYVKQELGGSDTDVAIALGASGAGSMLAALAVPRWLRSRSERVWAFAGGIAMTAAMAATVTEPGLVGLSAAWLVAGVGWSLIQTPAGQVVNRSSPRAELGPYFAAHFSLTHLCWLVCYPLAGSIGSSIGIAGAAAVMTGLTGCATIAGWKLWPKGTEA